MNILSFTKSRIDIVFMDNVLVVSCYLLSYKVILLSLINYVKREQVWWTKKPDIQFKVDLLILKSPDPKSDFKNVCQCVMFCC